jgi:protein TonB
VNFGPNAFRPNHPPRKSTGERIAGIAFVAGIHIAIVYALLTTLGVVDLPKAVSDLTIVNIAELPEQETKPPPAMPEFQAPPVEAPAPVVELQYVPPQPKAITLPPPEPVTAPPVQHTVEAPPAPSPPQAAPVVTPPVSIAETHTIPEYPPVSRRLREHGTTRLRLAVNDKGIVTDAEVMDSSGYKRLDDAAAAWIKTYWRYQPAREDNRPVASVVEAEVEFHLY